MRSLLYGSGDNACMCSPGAHTLRCPPRANCHANGAIFITHCMVVCIRRINTNSTVHIHSHADIVVIHCGKYGYACRAYQRHKGYKYIPPAGPVWGFWLFWLLNPFLYCCVPFFCCLVGCLFYFCLIFLVHVSPPMYCSMYPIVLLH